MIVKSQSVYNPSRTRSEKIVVIQKEKDDGRIHAVRAQGVETEHSRAFSVISPKLRLLREARPEEKEEVELAMVIVKSQAVMTRAEEEATRQQGGESNRYAQRWQLDVVEG